jgi:two-component system, NtrC family, response regulator GlrR
VLEQADGNVSRAARLACKERRAFGKLLKKHGLTTHGLKTHESVRSDATLR